MTMLTEPITIETSETLTREELQRGYLESLRYSLKIGTISILKIKLKSRERYPTPSCPPDLRAEFFEILSKAYAAFAIEAVHGEGSLLDLDHPGLEQLARKPGYKGQPAISEDEIRAAEAYRRRLRRS